MLEQQWLNWIEDAIKSSDKEWFYYDQEIVKDVIWKRIEIDFSCSRCLLKNIWISTWRSQWNYTEEINQLTFTVIYRCFTKGTRKIARTTAVFFVMLINLNEHRNRFLLLCSDWQLDCCFFTEQFPPLLQRRAHVVFFNRERFGAEIGQSQNNAHRIEEMSSCKMLTRIFTVFAGVIRPADASYFMGRGRNTNTLMLAWWMFAWILF